MSQVFRWICKLRSLLRPIFYSITEKSLEEPEKAPNHEPTKDQVTEEKTVNEISEETAKVWIL